MIIGHLLINGYLMTSKHVVIALLFCLVLTLLLSFRYCNLEKAHKSRPFISGYSFCLAVLLLARKTLRTFLLH